MLAGCASVTPNNSALLLENQKPIVVSALPRPKPLISSSGQYGQFVEDISEDEVAFEDTAVEVNDPQEELNRTFFGFNRGFDRVVARPLSKVYGAVLPSLVRDSVRNLLRHSEIPGDLINYTLQGNTGEAKNTLIRLVVNSTLGIGGLFDVAADNGVEYNPTDFGLTLASFGVQEGKYLVLPILGPSNQRDGVGRLVDIALSPQSYIGVITDFNFGGLISRGVETIDRRERNGELLDNVIFASPDPYVTLRSTFLQRRRALASGNVLGAEGMEDALPVIATAGQ